MEETDDISIIQKIDNKLALFIKIITVVMLAIIVLVTALSVISRFVFFMPLNFANPLSIYLMIWISFLGSGLAIRRSEHIFVEMFLNRFESRKRIVVLVIINFIISVFLIFMIFYGFKFAITGIGSHDDFVFNMSMFYPYLSIPVGMIYMQITIILKTCIEIDIFKKTNNYISLGRGD